MNNPNWLACRFIFLFMHIYISHINVAYIRSIVLALGLRSRTRLFSLRSLRCRIFWGNKQNSCCWLVYCCLVCQLFLLHLFLFHFYFVVFFCLVATSVQFFISTFAFSCCFCQQWLLLLFYCMYWNIETCLFLMALSCVSISPWRKCNSNIRTI